MVLKSVFKKIKNYFYTTQQNKLFHLITIVFLFVCVAGAPHSVAVAQGGFLLAGICWLIGGAISHKLDIEKIGTDISIAIFLLLCFLSSILSYEPWLSIDGMRSLAVIGLIYLLVSNINKISLAVSLALILLLSCQINCIYTLCQRVIGVGVQIVSLEPDSPLIRTGIKPGDVILQVEGTPLKALETISQIVDGKESSSLIKLLVRRHESIFETRLRCSAVTGKKRGHSTPMVKQGVDRLGAKWSRAHDFRAMGFYSHFATYAEVLQLITSLALGIWLSLLNKSKKIFPNFLNKHKTQFFIGVTVLISLSALICTATRAPLAGIGISFLVMLIALTYSGKLNKRFLLGALIFILSIGVIGIGLAYKMRGIANFDTQEGSTFWRLVVWQEGMHLIERHPWFGIGKNSDKIHGLDWGLWSNGQLPPGHFHSTFLQIAVWWGLPALIAYIWMICSWVKTLWDFSITNSHEENFLQILSNGIVLGTLGGLAGFITSSFVHFNFGDAEAIIVLYIMLGIAIAIIKLRSSDEIV